MRAPILAAVMTTLAACSTPSAVLRDLEEHYRVSRIEVQSQATTGEVLRRRQGVRLAVQADVPARKLRILQAGPKGLRFHARDYARVDIAGDRLSTSAPGELTIPKGTELVVLEQTIHADRVHLFLHTAQALATVDGDRVYGCTEMVFHVDPAVLQRSDLAAVQSLIDPWLVPVASR